MTAFRPALRWLASRLVLYGVAAWASISLGFVLPRLLPGDPVAGLVARLHGRLDPAALASLRASFGVSDAPMWRQYLDYLGQLARADLGLSIAWFPAPVTDVIRTGIGWTALLAGISVVTSFLLGSGLGMLAAWRRGGWIDQIAPPLFSLLGAFPYFWLAMVALHVFGFTLGWFPLRHAYADSLAPSLSWPFVRSVVCHAALPSLVMVAATAGGWLLGMRNTMIGVLGAEHVTLAHARGLHPLRVMLRYGARNAILPNLSGFGLALGFVVSGSLLTEVVFAYPGQGWLLVQAVRAQDYPLMQGLFLTITLSVLAANLLVDLVTLWADPRTRTA
jgi:peptide/nickel transport system permease protein